MNIRYRRARCGIGSPSLSELVRDHFQLIGIFDDHDLAASVGQVDKPSCSNGDAYVEEMPLMRLAS